MPASPGRRSGGRGLPPIFSVIFNQEEAKFDAPAGPFSIGLGMCVPTVIAFHSPDRIKRYVAGAARRGNLVPALLRAQRRLRRRRPQDQGRARWRRLDRSTARRCGPPARSFRTIGILLVRTNPDVEKHKGLTMFIVDMKQTGVDVRPIHQMSGGRDFNEVYFTDVRIPDSEPPRRSRQGLERGARDADERAPRRRRLVRVPTTRRSSSSPATSPSPTGEGTLIQDEAFRQKLADWIVRAEGYKLGKFRTMTALSKGQTPGPESSIGKVINANQMMDIANTAIEAQDHYGIINDPELAPLEGAFHRATCSRRACASPAAPTRF